MPTADPDLAQELRAVERARDGDHHAFVALYRQDAPPAWRLGLALTADPDRAADAVARAFARTLAPLRVGTVRSEVPFQLRLLAATRHVVLDLGTLSHRSATPLPDPAAGDDAVDDVERARRRAAEVLHAFHQLPERWRTILWLLTVEGIGTAEAAGILDVAPADAEELATRALVGLRTQWVRDRANPGHPHPVAPDHLERRLQTVLPLPLDLFDAAQQHWAATRRPSTGPLRLALPGGRPVPRWAERSLLASTAALIALGITSALAVDRDPDIRKARGASVASGDTSTSTTMAVPPEPKAYLDGDPAGLFASAEPILARRSSGGRGLAATDTTVTAAAVGGATSASTSSKSTPAPTSPAADSPSTTLAPLIEVTAGIGHTLGLSVGDQCTGVELAGQVAGCAPDTRDDGVTLDADGSLLGA